jgi:argininosuccinate synthase
MIQAAIDETQKNVEGTVRLKLYKGNVMVVGRTSPKTLFSVKHIVHLKLIVFMIKKMQQDL